MNRRSTEVTVHVKVIDKSMPIFDKQFYSVSVPENIDLNSHLSVSMKAESSLSRKLIYSISNGNTMEQFAIDFNTGKKKEKSELLIFLRRPPLVVPSWRDAVESYSFIFFLSSG